MNSRPLSSLAYVLPSLSGCLINISNDDVQNCTYPFPLQPLHHSVPHLSKWQFHPAKYSGQHLWCQPWLLSLSLSLKNLNPNTYKPCKHYLQNKFRIPPVFTTPTATTLVQDFIILLELWQKPTIMSPYLQLCPLLYPSDYFQCNRDDPITPLFKTSNGFHFIESKVQISSYNLWGSLWSALTHLTPRCPAI